MRDSKEEPRKSNPAVSDPLRCVEIFAGIGGLALGVALAGFKHEALVEKDPAACNTIRTNQANGVRHVADWPLFEQTVQEFDYSQIAEGLDLLCGGPPCQPFSLAGNSFGKHDPRDMFPEAIRAVRELRPKAFLFENVAGLLRPSHSGYVEYLRLQLSSPHVTAKPGERTHSHLARLERHFTGSKILDEKYDVIFHRVDAANYGVPQRRTRIFIVGIRRDLEVEWSFPEPTHSREALIFSQLVDHSYWDEHEVSRRLRVSISDSTREKLLRLNGDQPRKRWLTVRDAIGGLPEPSKSKHPLLKNHIFVPGARTYVGHTGSHWDYPAKTLKAGVHGVPGGENMVRHTNGKVRYFSVREQARLQTIPDDVSIEGNWSETTRQLGNAVPVILARVAASSIHDILLNKR